MSDITRSTPFRWGVRLAPLLLVTVAVWIVLSRDAERVSAEGEAGDRAEIPVESTLAETTQLLTELRLRLEAREREVSERERRVGVREEEVRRQLEQLQRMKDEFEKAVAARKVEETEDLKRLVEIYRKMRPANVAQAVLDLYLHDEALALTILRELSPRDVAKLMDIIVTNDPAIAARISEQMARPDGGSGTDRRNSAAPAAPVGSADEATNAEGEEE